MTPSKNKVLESIHNDSSDQCVDIFVRPDGSFGFEEFRRDIEDGGAWSSLRRYSTLKFGSMEEAVQQARHYVTWLNTGNSQ